MTISIKPTASGSTIEQNGSTILTVDNSGNITPSNDLYPKVPAFRASASGAQTLSSTTFTKINFATEEFDTAGFYDPSTSRFQPTIAGYYHICSSVRASGVSNNCRFDTAYYIDGSISTYGMGLSNGDTRDMQTFAAVLMYLDGTQYVEVYVEQNSGINNNVLATNNASATEGGITYFTGYLVHAT